MADTKGGRPPRGEFVGKTSIMTVRLRPDTRDAVSASARSNNRSLAQEIERRLNDSFDYEKEISNIFGSKKNFALMRQVAATIEATEGKWSDGTSWTNDAFLFDQVVAAINHTLGYFRPEGDRTEWTAIGKVAAAEIANDIREANLTLPLDEKSGRKVLASRIRAGLGEDMVGRIPSTMKNIGVISPELLPHVEQARRENRSVLDVYREGSERDAATPKPRNRK